MINDHQLVCSQAEGAVTLGGGTGSSPALCPPSFPVRADAAVGGPHQQLCQVRGEPGRCGEQPSLPSPLRLRHPAARGIKLKWFAHVLVSGLIRFDLGPASSPACSSITFPFHPSAPATLTSSFLFLRYSQQAPASGPSHLLSHYLEYFPITMCKTEALYLFSDPLHPL